MKDLITIETITGWLTEQVKSKSPIDPGTWVDAAAKINMLLQDEQEKLFEMEQEVAKIRNIAIESGETVSRAKSRVEATDEYKNARKQKAKIERAIEAIRISKLQARMSSDIMRGL